MLHLGVRPWTRLNYRSIEASISPAGLRRSSRHWRQRASTPLKLIATDLASRVSIRFRSRTSISYQLGRSFPVGIKFSKTNGTKWVLPAQELASSLGTDEPVSDCTNSMMRCGAVTAYRHVSHRRPAGLQRRSRISTILRAATSGPAKDDRPKWLRCVHFWTVLSN